MPYSATHAPTGTAGAAVVAPDTTGNLTINPNNTGFTVVPPLASGFVSGHCPQPTLSGGIWTMADTGAACGAGGGVLGPLQVPNIFSAVNPPQTLSPFTVQANQVFNSNTLYFSDGTAYNDAGANYVANGNYIADQTFACRNNPGACSDTFILNLLTKYTAHVDGNGQFPINLSSTLTPLYYSSFDFHHAFASADGAIFMPQLLYLYCQKWGLASTQCGSAYTANVAAIKTAWAFYPRDGSSHLFQVVSGNEYVLTTGFQEYVRNTGLVADGNVWYAADMADLAAIATAQGDTTNATFFNTEHTNVVAGIRANLIDGGNGLLLSASGQNSGNDALPSTTLAVACDYQPTIQAACGILTSGQKTTIETYLNTNYASLTNGNGAVLQTPQSAWAQFGCIQAGGGTPYNGGGCPGYSGSAYQGALWFYFNSQFAIALGQVNPAKVATFLNTNLNPASGDTAMEWNERGSTALPGAASTNYMASVQWGVAANNAYPLAQTVTPGAACLNLYGAQVKCPFIISQGGTSIAQNPTIARHILGQSNASAEVLDVYNSNITGPSAIGFTDYQGNTNTGFGYGNPSFGISYFANAMYRFINTAGGTICDTTEIGVGCDLLIDATHKTTISNALTVNGGTANNVVSTLKSASTSNTAAFLTNTSSGGHAWADLVNGSTSPDVGNRA
jgi:hypothetical protein